MMLKSWNSIEEVPYYFSRSSVKFQGHKGQISLILSIIERFRLSLQFEFTDGFEIISKAWSSIEEVPYCLSRSSIKFQGHTGQKCDRQFRPKLSVSGLQRQFEFTNGFEMMHKAWCSTEEVPYCFSRSSIKFEALMDRKIDDLNPILSKITRLVAAIKSLRFALFYTLWITFLQYCGWWLPSDATNEVICYCIKPFNPEHPDLTHETFIFRENGLFNGSVYHLLDMITYIPSQWLAFQTSNNYCGVI